MCRLTKKERFRRLVLLCCHFTRNFAYYSTSHGRLTNGNYSQILVTIDGNFLDMAVIDWCKIFGDKKGKHHWRKVVTHQSFEEDMLIHIGETADQFESYIDEFRVYRDKFLAHLDNERVANIPELGRAWLVVKYLHEHLVHKEDSICDLNRLPTDLKAYYQQCCKEATTLLDHCNL